MSTFPHLYSNALDLTKHLRQLPGQISQQMLDFSSNDYLGLSSHPELLEAAYQAGLDYGVGSTGSRLICGNFPLLEELEAKIAQSKGTEAAVIFNSGYQANQSVLTSLSHAKYISHKSILFFDKLNHASLYQAVSKDQVELIRYPHQDLNRLTTLLTKYEKDPRPKFIVTESLFGMDGDISSIKHLNSLAKEFGAFLYLDESHATGILGENGYGLSQMVELATVPCVSMGTFSKGLGTGGAYIACSSLIKQYLINHCPGLIYSTALSPMVVGAANQAWKMLPQFTEKRKNMFNLAEHLRKELQTLGLNTGLSTTHIVPVLLPNVDRALSLQTQLKNRGILVSVIRPPSVPANGLRLRIALNVNHTKDNITKLIQALREMV